MNAKKIIAMLLAVVMTLSLAACGSKQEAPATEAAAAGKEETAQAEASALPSYADLKIGEDYTNLTAEISFFHNRTDMDKDGRMDAYIAEFNKLYPNITIKQSSTTNYEEDSLLRLTTADWGDMMYLWDNVQPIDYADYFMPWGSVEEIGKTMKFADTRAYDGVVYGMPFYGSYTGVIYNKAVFEEAGITEWPATAEEFHEALLAIRDKTDAIPMYTNYADSWPVNAWNDYANQSYGDPEFKSHVKYHTANPYADNGEGTGLYNLYKILWDAVADDCTEEDYTTTDWEGGKAMLCNGEIGCMFLGSWYYVQSAVAGEHPENLAYAPLPMTVDGKQYVVGGGDSFFGINKNVSDDHKLACMLFAKWLAENSTYCIDEMVIPACVNGKAPAFVEELSDIPVLSNAPVHTDEVEMVRKMDNATTAIEVHYLIEAADAGSDTFDNVMNEWNQIWSDAQASVGVEIVK